MAKPNQATGQSEEMKNPFSRIANRLAPWEGGAPKNCLAFCGVCIFCVPCMVVWECVFGEPTPKRRKGGHQNGPSTQTFT